jgi:hypothetical protein
LFYPAGCCLGKSSPDDTRRQAAGALLRRRLERSCSGHDSLNGTNNGRRLGKLNVMVGARHRHPLPLRHQDHTNHLVRMLPSESPDIDPARRVSHRHVWRRHVRGRQKRRQFVRDLIRGPRLSPRPAPSEARPIRNYRPRNPRHFRSRQHPIEGDTRNPRFQDDHRRARARAVDVELGPADIDDSPGRGLLMMPSSMMDCPRARIGVPKTNRGGITDSSD